MWKTKGGALKARKPEAKNKKNGTGNGNTGIVNIKDNLGVKAAMMEERQIEECLSCKKPECNGCMIPHYKKEVAAG